MHCHNGRELIDGTALFCSENCFFSHWNHPLPLAIRIFLSPSSAMTPELCGEVCDTDVPFGTENSEVFCSPQIDQL